MSRSNRDDPTGTLAALAEVNPGALSARQQTIAGAIALIDAGESINAAAKATGIPYTTLYRHHRGLADPDYEKSFIKGESALVDAQLTIASRASEIVLERLDKGEMKDADVIKAMGVAVDKVAIKRRWNAPNDKDYEQTGLSALARLLQGHDLTLTQRSPDADAIDVTPDDSDDQTS